MPKERYFSMFRLRHAADQAVVEFNQGSTPLRKQIDCLNWGSGDFTLRHQQRHDALRRRYSVIKRTIKYANQARKRRLAAAELRRRAGQQEQLYQAGGDDLPGPSSPKD
jgi:hypothetical protein